MKTIDGHTFDETRLTPGSVVIDIGCRGFGFAKYCAERGCKVFAIDADPAIENPHIPNVEYIHTAVVADSYPAETIPLYRDEGDEGFNVMRGTLERAVWVPALRFGSVLQIARSVSPDIELIKFDCEGAEYQILTELTEPPAKQLSIEFHDFLGGMNPSADPAAWHKTMKCKLGRWYNNFGYRTSRTPWPPHDQHYIDVSLTPIEPTPDVA